MFNLNEKLLNITGVKDVFPRKDIDNTQEWNIICNREQVKEARTKIQPILNNEELDPSVLNQSTSRPYIKTFEEDSQSSGSSLSSACSQSFGSVDLAEFQFDLRGNKDGTHPLEGKEILTATTSPTNMSGLTTSTYAEVTRERKREYSTDKQNSEIQELKRQLQEKGDTIKRFNEQLDKIRKECETRTIELITQILDQQKLQVPPSLKRTKETFPPSPEHKRSDLKPTPDRTTENPQIEMTSTTQDETQQDFH